MKEIHPYVEEVVNTCNAPEEGVRRVSAMGRRMCHILQPKTCWEGRSNDAHVYAEHIVV